MNDDSLRVKDRSNACGVTLERLCAISIALKLKTCNDVFSLSVPTRCKLLIVEMWLTIYKTFTKESIARANNDRNESFRNSIVHLVTSIDTSWLHKRFWNIYDRFDPMESALFKSYARVLSRCCWIPEYSESFSSFSSFSSSTSLTIIVFDKFYVSYMIPFVRMCEECVGILIAHSSMLSNVATDRNLANCFKLCAKVVTIAEFLDRYVSSSDSWCELCDSCPLYEVVARDRTVHINVT